MAITGIGSNYNVYESTYVAQKNEAAKKAETKETATQTGVTANIENGKVSDYYSYLQKNYDCMSKGKSDTAVISEEGRKALQNRRSAFAKTGTTEVRRLSSVSSFGYCNDYEKILSELSNGCASDEFVTENYSQGKVDALKSKFEFQDEVKTDNFDCHVNKMVSAYNLMKDAIEDKYANPDRELEYYVADDGSMQELTKEKELEMLDKAYEQHSIFMAASTEIWADLRDFQPQITYSSNAGQAATYEIQTFQAGYKKNEIKNQAYQAFMSAISDENRNMLLQEQGNLNHLKLNLSISSSARTRINSIWDYYANQKH